MKCFYHTDMDGHASGAIVYQSEIGNGNKIECIPMNYNNPFPFETIEPGEKVYIVDYSLKNDDWKKLLEITQDVIWIDHHKTAIEAAIGQAWGWLEGIRRDGTAACELVWEWFYPKEKSPKIIKLLGDYDIWRFQYGDDTNYLQTGIRLHETKPESIGWELWLDCEYNPSVEIASRKIAIQYRDSYYKGLVKAFGFYADFEGLRAICCNAGSVSSQLFQTVDSNTYDIMMPFVFTGEGWTVSVYSTNSEIDCSAIAKKYGGGGHKGAAGFQCKELPFAKKQ
jgi:oligoribonuclease NrnB/cAMP/cGMP phosphodiesterase (DHH superfamily)